MEKLNSTLQTVFYLIWIPLGVVLFIGVLYFALNNPFSQNQKTIGQPMMPQNNGYQGSQVGTPQQMQGGNQGNGMMQQGFGNYQGQQGQQNQRNNFQQSGGPQ